MGNSNVTEPSAEQKASLKLLLVHLMAEHSIPASEIKGHNDIRKEHGLAGTACPGKKLARYLDRLVGEL